MAGLASVRHAICFAVVVCAADRGEGVFYAKCEVWEDFHEADNALALLDFDFGILDRTDLFFHELSEHVLQSALE